jgi:hypothetical protein
MSFLLCHECFTWVEPTEERCPDCLHTLDASTPDPSVDRLRVVIGDVVCPVGECQVRRKLLPDRGTLYATTNGFLFLPHHTEQYIEYVPPDGTATSLLWSLAAMVWSPLALVLPFVKSSPRVPRRVQISRPRIVPPAQSDCLPDLLIQNPGAFFVPANSIRLVARRWRRWTIERAQGFRVRIKPASELFHSQMAGWLASDAWPHVLVVR